MRNKKKLIALIVIAVLVMAIQVVLPRNPSWTIIYADYIFVPYQSFRNAIFGWSQLSFGDLLYCLGGIVLIALLVKWVYYIVTIRRNARYLGQSLLNTLLFVSGIYLLFLLSWGGNYYKPSLTAYWGMDKNKWNDSITELQYDSFLINKLNTYAALYKPVKFKQVRKDAMKLYKTQTDCKARLQGLNIKPSIYGYFMQNLGIQGYYNPITGEAQVNRFLPAYMLPFVVIHEIAHQAGIAAEDDANLLAYTIGVRSDNPSFRYSSYLNMYLYNHYRVHKRDSVLAADIKTMLNPLTIQHIDTLKQIRERYRSEFSSYSTDLYDFYLKALQQEDGIGSYNEVVITGWTWESTDSVKQRNKLRIP